MSWSLWTDWCAATGHDPARVDEVSLSEYGACVSRPGLVAVRAEAIRKGLLTSTPGRPDDARELAWVGVDEALERCPAFGWPDAVQGRRDGWLIVLIRVLGLTRREAVEVSPSDAENLWKTIPRNDPVCYRCVARRWLEVVALDTSWGRGSVRQMLARHGPSSALACDTKCEQIPVIEPWHLLSPPVDRYGSIQQNHSAEKVGRRPPLAPRSVTFVMAHRCLAGFAPAPVPTPVRDAEGPVRRFDETTFARLDAICDAADETNSRVRDFIDQVDAHHARRA